MILLRKIQELTLYVIEQRQEINELRKELNSPDLSGKKVEELTLLLIEMNKKMEYMNTLNREQNQRINQLELQNHLQK